jgi:hypothetical protein
MPKPPPDEPPGPEPQFWYGVIVGLLVVIVLYVVVWFLWSTL